MRHPQCASFLQTISVSYCPYFSVMPATQREQMRLHSLRHGYLGCSPARSYRDVSKILVFSRLRTGLLRIFVDRAANPSYTAPELGEYLPPDVRLSTKTHYLNVHDL